MGMSWLSSGVCTGLQGLKEQTSGPSVHVARPRRVIRRTACRGFFTPRAEDCPVGWSGDEVMIGAVEVESDRQCIFAVLNAYRNLIRDEIPFSVQYFFFLVDDRWLFL